MYTLGIYIYILCVKVAALFGHKKARRKLAGHKETSAILKEKVKKGESYVWFHVSSRGGFEQARPMIERMRATHPEYRIALTFFSPSGYEMAKNYQQADVVCFLPFDTCRNVRWFLDILQPKMAFFVKCEFWLNFLTALKRRSVPAYSVSSVFRREPLLLRIAARQMREALHCFERLYVQDAESKRFLEKIGVFNVAVAGNTRFDRVVKVLEQARQLPLLEQFAGEKPVFVAGASEKDDEAVYMPFFNKNKACKLVVVPNDVSDEHVTAVEKAYNGVCVRYTRASVEEAQEAGCMIIDSYGLLSSVYGYGTVAYVGGGFGKGVHNVLEAAVYGVPLILGPNNERSLAARKLKECGGAVEVRDAHGFDESMLLLLADDECRAKAGAAAERFVLESAGATAKIFEDIGL